MESAQQAIRATVFSKRRDEIRSRGQRRMHATFPIPLQHTLNKAQRSCGLDGLQT